MPTYSYKAIANGTGIVKGTIAADTPRQARDLLRERGLVIDDIRSTAQPRVWLGWRSEPRRVPASQIAVVSRELATLLGVGITITDALETLSNQHRGNVQRALMAMHQRIVAGSSVAQAVAETPELFDPLDTSLVRMGEASGHLDQALEQIADFRESSTRFRDKLGTALLYPAIVFTMAIAITLFLMTSVVPTLIDALIEADRELPRSTQIVKAASDVLIGYWWALLSGCSLIVAVVALCYRVPKARRLIDRLILRVPVIGPLLVKQEIARVAFVIATLSRAGVGLIDAFELAGRSTRNTNIRQTIENCRLSLIEGKEASMSLAEDQVFPPMAVQILSVGQESGRLEEMLLRLANDYTRQVATASERLTAILDPVIIVVLAFVVGFIAFATILPIMEMGNVL